MTRVDEHELIADARTAYKHHHRHYPARVMFSRHLFREEDEILLSNRGSRIGVSRPSCVRTLNERRCREDGLYRSALQGADQTEVSSLGTEHREFAMVGGLLILSLTEAKEILYSARQLSTKM